jgi:cell wall-associated NlpC family hydrolase
MTMVEAADRVQTIIATIESMSAKKATPVDTTTATSFAAALSATSGAGSIAGGSVATGSATGADVVDAAKKYLGVPYVFGGEDSSGMDCSGLVQRVYADLGIDLPRRVTQQMTQGTEVASLADAKPGDLIVTGGGDHILIYAGDGKVIHAPYEGRTVSLVDAYMSDDEITTIRRIIPESSTASSSTGAMTDLIAAARLAMFSGGTP